MLCSRTVEPEVQMTLPPGPFDAAEGQRGDYARVSLKNLHLTVKCGLHAWERHPERPNRLVVNIDMYAPWPLPPRADGSPGFIDYDDVRRGLLAWEGREHVDLLETLVEDAIALCFADPLVQACRVSIMKPDIFEEADGAGVEVFRNRPAG
jgi:dihydroneopterin aldolase